MLNDNVGKSVYSTRTLVRDIFTFIKPNLPRFVFATALRAVSDIAWLYPAYGVAMLVNFLTKHHFGESLAPMWMIFFWFVISVILRYSGQYYAKRVGFRVSERASLDAQMLSIRHMFRLDIYWHEHENTGNKLKKIVRGGESINRILRIWINNFIEIIINFIGITFVIARFDLHIAIVTVVFLTSYYAIAYVFRRQASQAAQIVNAKEEDVQGLLFESINNIRSVKVLAMAGALLDILTEKPMICLIKFLNGCFGSKPETQCAPYGHIFSGSPSWRTDLTPILETAKS